MKNSYKYLILSIIVSIFKISVITAQNVNFTTYIPPQIAVESIVHSYSDIFALAGYDSARNDWFCETKGGRRFYWEGGRLLFQSTPRNKDYKPYIAYIYPEEIPDPCNLPHDILDYLRSDSFQNKRETQGELEQTFYALIYGSSISKGSQRAYIEANNQKTTFCGWNVTVNKRIVQPLKKVEQEVLQIATHDPEVQKFLSTLSSVGGYNWRVIADSGNLSNHSWGMAIDFLPKSWGSKIIYWFWESKRNKNWMTVPLNRRWAPPQAVITAFENNGFTWGGKWLIWDNMHFEYRPELLEIRRRMVVNKTQTSIIHDVTEPFTSSKTHTAVIGQ